MIPIIGVMGGVYMVTRLLSLILRTGDQEEHVVVRVISGLVIMLILALMSALMGIE